MRFWAIWSKESKLWTMLIYFSTPDSKNNLVKKAFKFHMKCHFTFVRMLLIKFTFKGFFPPWIVMIMVFQITSMRKGRFSDFTVQWLLSIMNWCNMPLQVTFSRTHIVAKLTIEWLLSFMNWNNMFLQANPLRKSVFTKITFEGLFSFMNWKNMCFQVTFVRKGQFTEFTIKWLLSFMNRCNMIF